MVLFRVSRSCRNRRAHFRLINHLKIEIPSNLISRAEPIRDAARSLLRVDLALLSEGAHTSIYIVEGIWISYEWGGYNYF